jgi:lysophospholipase L1-like esterase
LKRRVGRLLLVAEALALILLVRNFLYVTTWRLYLDGPQARTSAAGAAQRFEVEGGRVVPEILVPSDDRIRFAVRMARPSTVRFTARPAGDSSYEVALIAGGGERQVVGRGEVGGTMAVSHSLPAFDGVLEIANRGSMIWADLRIVNDVRFRPHLGTLALLLCLSLGLPMVDAGFAPSLRGVMTPAAVRAGLALASTVSSLGLAETALRALGPRVGAGITAQRRALGEAWPNPRWQDSERYGARLREGVHSYAEVTFGDIVQMGFVPPDVAAGRVRRFPFVTDAEGFRNRSVRDPIEVAALGDSFTDAMTLPVEQAWPARLEARLGRPVQNYGTAGFGPQQEERVLADFALRHHPRLVVVAFFAGNDIFNAESFDDFVRDPGHAPPRPPGWRIKDIVARFDDLYLVSLARAAADAVGKAEAVRAAEGPADDALEPPAPAGSRATFDRGMFAVPVAGRSLRIALMPPYLNTLRFSRDDLRARRGWALTRATVERMQRLCRDARAELVVMFVPFKSQVYLPLLRRSFRREELENALGFYFRGEKTAVDVEVMERNRLAQNELMESLCGELGIAFVDLTPELETQVASGHNVYFPDDAHWNAAGHEIAGRVLGDFFRAHGAVPKPRIQ